MDKTVVADQLQTEADSGSGRPLRVEVVVVVLVISLARLAALFYVMEAHFPHQQQQLATLQLQFQGDIGTTILLALGALLSNGTFCTN
jgi:hypothetical protein